MSTEPEGFDCQQDIITTLKTLLAEANRGELSGITYVAIRGQDLGVSYGMAGNVLADPFHSLGALQYAQAELVSLVSESVHTESNGTFQA